MHTTRTFTLIAVGAALSLMGCGADSPDETTSAGGGSGHNAADVAFASDMVQHHAQALTMVDLTAGRDLDPEVQELADGIRDAQVPEIETMVDWLTEWDEEIPATVRDHANADEDHGMGHGDMDTGMDGDMPGMMSAEDMTALEQAPDAQFEDLWLEMMIEHHEGAVEMARTEQTDGEYAAAIDLAEQIVESQSSEIEQMRALLDS